MDPETSPGGAPDAGDGPTPGPAPAAGRKPAPKGLLASALAPVDVARPTDEKPVEGSSATFHQPDGTSETTSEGYEAGPQPGVLKALLLAAIERWRKGGDAHLKKLDADKAKAQARQVKATHTINENRISGSSSQNASKRDAKSLDTKASQSQNVSKRDAKHNDSKARQDKNDNTNRNDNAKKSSADSKTGRDDKNHSGSQSTRSGKDHKDAKTGSSKDSKDSSSRDTKSHKGDAKKSSATSSDSKPSSKDGMKGGSTDAKGSDSKGKTDAPKGGGKTTGTRPARETGYRDGVRAARGAAQVKAWGHGVKDGWDAVKEAAGREKERLDKARDERKQQRNQEDKEGKPVSPGATSADHHQPEATPVTVTGVDAKTIQLGNDASRDSMSRGEVRCLFQYEQRLDGKITYLTQQADNAKLVVAKTAEQHQKAAALAEAACQVRGGEKLAGALARLAEATQAQQARAEEIHQRAQRAAEAARVVKAGVATRYRPIYKAVVDSPETAPAELTFYKDGGFRG